MSRGHDEFLPKPRWRTRADRTSLWSAIVVTFTIYVAIGAVILFFGIVLLDYADVPGWVVLAAWLLPTIGVLIWALRGRQPATASDYEAQSWSDYAVRAVMIGIEQPRSAPARVITAVLFGAPLAIWLLIGLALDLLGIL